MPRSLSAPARVIAVLALVFVTACSAIVRNHGYVPPDEDLARIEVGRDTRDSVAAALGRPGISGILDDSGWYYVRHTTRTMAWQAPEEVNRDVVAISFSPSGTVTNVERFGLEDGRVVRLSRRVTEGGSAGVGFLRQAFGNLGRIDGSQFFN